MSLISSQIILIASAVMLAFTPILISPKPATATSQPIAEIAAISCQGNRYLNYVRADTTRFINPGECVKYAISTGMLLRYHISARFEASTCGFLYDEPTLRLTHLVVYHSSTGTDAVQCLLSKTESSTILVEAIALPGQTVIIPTLHLGITGHWVSYQGETFLSMPIRLTFSSHQILE